MYRINPLYMTDAYDALTTFDVPPTLYSLMESKINYENPSPVKIENLPEAFRTYLFDFDYPLDAQYRYNFEIIFLNHYMFRRIGFETYLSFKLHLKTKLWEIMPKYNKMLEGFSKLDFDGDVETEVRNENETGASTSHTTNDNRFSSLPQNELEDVQDGSYMTDYTYNTGDGNNTANRNTNENITRKRLDTLDEYEKFMKFSNNIYSDIFKECECLFFGVV